MIEYGIITGEFTPKSSDVTWVQNIYNKDGSASLCFCIKSGKELTGGNVTVIGSNDDFISLTNKYRPETTI